MVIYILLFFVQTIHARPKVTNIYKHHPKQNKEQKFPASSMLLFKFDTATSVLEGVGTSDCGLWAEKTHDFLKPIGIRKIANNNLLVPASKCWQLFSISSTK